MESQNGFGQETDKGLKKNLWFSDKRQILFLRLVSVVLFVAVCAGAAYLFIDRNEAQKKVNRSPFTYKKNIQFSVLY